jgi:hypothetical protein
LRGFSYLYCYKLPDEKPRAEAVVAKNVGRTGRGGGEAESREEIAKRKRRREI